MVDVDPSLRRELESLNRFLRVKPLYFDFDEGVFVWLDTRLIPFKEVYRRTADYRRVARAIVDMEIRGAPAIGVAAAYGLALAAAEAASRGGDGFMEAVSEARRRIESTRPTAYNLFWATASVYNAVAEAYRKSGLDAAVRAGLEEATRIYVEDVKGNVEIGRVGSRLLESGDTVLTHCNTGALATAGFGTALGVIRYAWMEGKDISVVTTETRPVLQGARLNVWELRKEGIPFKLIVDSAAGLVMSRGMVSKAIVGADRIVSTGHTANKIGTYMVALAARRHGVPFYVAAPASTFQLDAGPEAIVIEERSPDEVRGVISEAGYVRITLGDVEAYNPSFDVTPPDLITAFITDRGVIEPPFDVNIKRALEG
ncbi:S-methyl-5-thioribose-1-phosphate isomerase [Aeropyrum camini]|uniref:Putative methylthioribose-1-phosphate isomerase n=1 Tax=Aeropyrum camini SY1 = JCM 12091 TaxID=1198449 RepID=U3TF64_9CREN|nr:S-methyl-5-thioribose-1-phosphate isomerase [Aeropyrum camini]BAN89979.1 methylthioribose-1-phosphate isomerase [Aeropyrum camini SY1 = JCM 12091]